MPELSAVTDLGGTKAGFFEDLAGQFGVGKVGDAVTLATSNGKLDFQKFLEVF